MNIGERIKLLRKNLNLSQQEFGSLLGLKPNSISNIETSKNSLTEQNIKIICSTFNINENWLRVGTGEMFVDAYVLSLDDYAKKCNATKNDLDFIRRYLDLEPNVRTALLNLFKEKI